MALTTDSLKLQRQRLNQVEDGINQIIPSREVSLSKTCLQRSIMFLGLALGDILDAPPTPYTESENAESPKIEPRADVSPEKYNFSSPKPNQLADAVQPGSKEDTTRHVAMVKELRHSMQVNIESMQGHYMTAADTKIKPGREPFFPTHLITAITAAEEAKMWLWMELNRVLEGQK